MGTSANSTPRAPATFASWVSCKFFRAGASMVLIGKDFWDFGSETASPQLDSELN